MRSFSYQAYDKQGRLSKGTISADSERLARRQLRDTGLMPMSLSEAREEKSFGSFTSRLPAMELSLIMRQLATLVNSGLPLDECLTLIAEQSDNQRQQRLLQDWRNELMQGQSLSGAMRRARVSIPESVVAAVAVGEETGHLPSVLNRLAEELVVAMANRQALGKGLIYPAVMATVAIVVISLLMVYVVPQVAQVFTSMKQELPTMPS